MAELIPLEYRINVARQRLITWWAGITGAAVVLSVAGLVFTYSWQQQRLRETSKLADEYQGKSVMIKQARELQAKRLDLAARMQKMQELRDDKTLLSLLKNVSDGFSSNDCLNSITISAHNSQGNGAAHADDRYSLEIRGITLNFSTHKDLFNRLTEIGHKSDPPMEVPPDKSRLEKYGDGEVFSFDIVCAQPKGN